MSLRITISTKLRLLTLAVLCCLSISACATGPGYDQLIRTAVPLYDQQNQQVYEALPIPSRTVEISQRSLGVTSGSAYGRHLEISYLSQQSIEDVLTTYDSFLLNNGWQAVSEKRDSVNQVESIKVIYFGDSACVQIYSLYQDGSTTPMPGTNYTVSIWHDFFAQPFSIPTPSGTNLCWEGGACLQCPPVTKGE